MNGLVRAGKKIRDVLIDAANVGVENVAGLSTCKNVS